MTHLPYIAGAYALATVIPITFAVMAFQRARLAHRRLAAVEKPRP